MAKKEEKKIKPNVKPEVPLDVQQTTNPPVKKTEQ